jgi:hypothetical protein
MTIPNLNPDYEALLRELAAQTPGAEETDVAMEDIDYGDEPEQDIPGAAEPYVAASSGTTTVVLDANGQRANEEVATNDLETAARITLPKDAELRALSRALYGDDFPLAEDNDGDDPQQWVNWVRNRWGERRMAIETHMHLVERNRLFRAGQQWVSATGLGPWREPVRPTESSRIVYNLIDKALDQRLHIITEQRPGFSINPMTLDPDDQRKAEARQAALEFAYESQQMGQVLQEACYWAQTDGISGMHVFWDPDAGPWDEAMGEGGGMQKPLGDLKTDVVRVEQFRVSANATATKKPYYVILREVIPAQEAAQRYGATGAVAAGGESTVALSDGGDALGDNGALANWTMSLSNPYEADRLRNADVVERYTVYVDKHPDLLPEGMQCVIVGNAVVTGPMPLLFGTIPFVRVSDGSTDPSYYPRPIMEQWIAHQQRINALMSKWVDSIRVNSGGRLLARPGVIAKETFIGGLTSIVEVTGAGSIGDSVVPMPAFSVANDIKEAMALEKKAFEDASGYNDTSRGQFSSSASGRAILAAREQLDRVIAPSVLAIANAMTHWAKAQLAGMAWGYDVPRDLGAVGKSRPDLARALKADDFDGTADVKVEPETLMPMPKAMRLFLLDEMFNKQIIDPVQYRKLMPFAMTKAIQSPDADQEARANRIADAILTRQNVPPMRWQDNESIHQDVLERKILLQDDIDEDVIQVADGRWRELANQAATKQGGGAQAPTPEQAGPAGPQAMGGESPFAPSPGMAPTQALLPGIAVEPANAQGAANMFEAFAPQ